MTGFSEESSTKTTTSIWAGSLHSTGGRRPQLPSGWGLVSFFFMKSCTPTPHRKPSHSILRDRKHGGSASCSFHLTLYVSGVVLVPRMRGCSPAGLRGRESLVGLKGQEQATERGSLGGQQEGLRGEQRPAWNLSGGPVREAAAMR